MENINGILLLYHHYLREDAPTIREHIGAWEQNSVFTVRKLNVEVGFYGGLRNLRFRIILLHYSLFGDLPFKLSNEYKRYIRECTESYKIVFFQDEHQFCPQRFTVINELGLDCIYTLLQPDSVKEVYGKHTKVKTIQHALTGYVSDDLIMRAKRLSKSDSERTIDIGYRARKLAFFMGRGSQEKHEIAEKFEAHANGLGLVLDIKPGSHRRLNGDDWYKFMANCKGFLGVEAGVSIFDLEDKVRTECDILLAENPLMTFEEISERVLKPWEDNIFYRTISPRHFEAAAFRVCQILYEGHYNGILKPMVHYIPLKKDFSNFDSVIKLFNDTNVRREITENAYHDLIASGNYTYKNFIEQFDAHLKSLGIEPKITPKDIRVVRSALNKGKAARFIRSVLLWIVYFRFPGRVKAVEIYKKHIRPNKLVGFVVEKISKRLKGI
jgi:hypothetical protein